MGHQLREAGFQSVWAPACQDHISGGHAGVGVVSLCGASLSAPSLVTPEFRKFFRLGGAGGFVGFYPFSLLTLEGWLTHGDFAMDSCAQFLAVALLGARSIGHQLRGANCQSVWAPACQDHISDVEWGSSVWVVPPLATPSIVSPEFLEFYRLGGALRVTLPTGFGVSYISL